MASSVECFCDVVEELCREPAVDKFGREVVLGWTRTFK
jgi:hypothetical protein